MSNIYKFTLNRREFIKGSVAAFAVAQVAGCQFLGEKGTVKKAKVILVKTKDRKEGVRKVLEIFRFPSVKGKEVLIKPNFNTADPTPGSTHNDTLSQIVHELKERGAAGIIVGERSGPPPTKRIMEEKGIFDLANELDFKVVNFEDLEESDWVHINPEGKASHWKDGFYIPRCVDEAEYIVSTCCLKTHQYGGIFTLSLKLAVGMTPKKMMRELHGEREDMRKMIAEINLGYKPKLIILDGIEAFVDGGPSRGTRKKADVFIAGDDRVAVDAVGIAVLKELGSNEAIMGRKIFEQDQIARAVELGLGIKESNQINIITPDKPSQEYAEKLETILAQG